jgi:hypothetical protein
MVINFSSRINMHLHEASPIYPTLCLINSVHVLMLFFRKIHFNILFSDLFLYPPADIVSVDFQRKILYAFLFFRIVMSSVSPRIVR